LCGVSSKGGCGLIFSKNDISNLSLPPFVALINVLGSLKLLVLHIVEDSDHFIS